MKELLISVEFFTFVVLVLALIGCLLIFTAFKSDLDSAKKTSRGLINGIMGGGIVGLTILTSQTPNKLALLITVCLCLFLAGVSFHIGININSD